jgi:hypothetical protein
MAPAQRLGSPQTRSFAATIAEKIEEKPGTFDRYILRYFAILQCDF